MHRPELLMVVDYRILHAYLVAQDGRPEIVEQTDFVQDGQTSAPLVNWNDGREAFKQVAARMFQILDRYRPSCWALACPPGFDISLARFLPDRYRRSLSVVHPPDVSAVGLSNLSEVFGVSLVPPLAGR